MVGALLAAIGACGDGGAPTSDVGDTSGDVGEELVDTLLVEAVIGPEGGTLRDEAHGVTVTFPEGALTEPTTLRLFARQVAPKADGAEDPWVVPTRRFLLEPAGLALAEPAWVHLKASAEAIPFPATGPDLGIYRRDDAGWSPIDLTPYAGSERHFPATFEVSGYTDRLGEFAARLHPPYDQPPVLTQIGYYDPVSLPSGPVTVVGAGGLHTIWGHNFGWDPSQVRVSVGGVSQPIHDLTNATVEFALGVPQPQNDKDFAVVVQVRGASSNTLVIRVAGLTSGKSVVDKVAPPGGAPRGTRVGMQGVFYGGLETRTVTLGGVTVPHELDGSGNLWFTVPSLAPLGPTQIVIADGLGGEPSDPVPYVVLPSEAPTLSPGLQAQGLWLPARLPTTTLDTYGPEIDLVFDVQNMPPYVSDASQLSVRYWTSDVDTDWQEILATSDTPLPCIGMPTGRCILRLPKALSFTLAEGDTVNVAVRVRVAQYPATGPLPKTPDWIHRESAPVQVTIAGRAIPGAVTTGHVGPWYGTVGWMCSGAGSPLAIGDVLCLRIGDTCHEGTCVAQQLVEAPALWDGQLPWGAHGVHGHCFPLAKAQTIAMHNESLGLSCEVEVAHTGGRVSAGSVHGVAHDQPLVLGLGGGRLSIPPGALPPLPAGDTYSVTVWAPSADDPGNPPLQSADPQAATALGTYQIQIHPEPSKLNAPIGLSLPVAPGGHGPSLGLIDRATGFVREVAAAYDALSGQLTWALPAGHYEAPKAEPPSGPVALPARFNAAFQDIGVLYRKHQPGVIEDAQGRVRVEYVVDASSDDYCTDPYAVWVLEAAVLAWEKLQGEGWEAPEETVRIFVRKTVSWASSTAKGATSSGFLGAVQVTIKSDLADNAEVRYVVAHEMGHVFQRQYTTNLTLSWLDEAAAEWAAFITLGELFPTEGMTGDQDAVRLVLAGLPSSWGGVSDPYIYGSSVWVLWLSWKKGTAMVRKLYEALDWSPSAWASVYTTLQSATGDSASTLMREFAEDFWLQRFTPVDKLALGAELAGVGPGNTMTLTATGDQPLPLTRPPLSSRRYRLDIPSALHTALGTGDLVLRVIDLDDGAELSVWSEASLTPDPAAPEEKARLSKDEPMIVLDELETGSWWIIHNNWSTSVTSEGTFTIDVPRVTGLTPTSASEGTIVQVSGQDLGTTKGELRVGGQPVQSGQWGPSGTWFTMPDFPNTQSVTVSITTSDGAKTNALTLQVVD